MGKILSYFLGLCLAVLVVAPPINYTIPLMVNTYHWLFLVILSGLLGIFLCRLNLHVALKFLAVYLFSGCFFSQSPYLSFNAYILVVSTFYFFLAFRSSDPEPVLSFIECAFWFQLILSAFQLAGMDKLLCFDRAFRLDEKTLQMSAFGVEYPKHVMMGTLMQYMRFSSLLAVMTPFLMLRNRWYGLLIAVMCVLSESSGFALSLAVGAFVYIVLRDRAWAKTRIPAVYSGSFISKKPKSHTLLLILSCFALCAAYAAYDWGSFRGAIIASNGGRLVSWWAVLQTWVMDTAKCQTVAHLSGPLNWKWLLLGHGMDTFLPLFPIYKHDPNPFPQAHNDWLQLPWEIGFIGLAAIVTYLTWLVRRLFKIQRHDLISGLAVIGTNMLFAFPMRMTQTMLLIVAFLSYCEQLLQPQNKGALK